MTDASSVAAPPLLAGGVREIESRYDALICDVWGVVYDGVSAVGVAANCLKEWRARGKRVVLLSNAPRRSRSMAEQLTERGLGAEFYDDLVTSGEVTWRLLHEEGEMSLEPPVFYIGPEGTGLREEFLSRVDVTDDIGEAGSLMIAGAPGDPWGTRIDGDDLLKRAAERGLTALCPNPDKFVRRGGQIEPCAGLVAAEYEELGGGVLYVGKPYRPVYEVCLRGLDRSGKVLAVGDGLPTDIRGASEMGFDSIFIASGVHGVLGSNEEMDALLLDLVSEHKVSPTWWMPQLSW